MEKISLRFLLSSFLGLGNPLVLPVSNKAQCVSDSFRNLTAEYTNAKYGESTQRPWLELGRAEELKGDLRDRRSESRNGCESKPFSMTQKP